MTNLPTIAKLANFLIVEVGRTLGVLAVIALTVMFMLSGVYVLYNDFSLVEGDNLEELIPTWEEIELAWEANEEDLREKHIPDTLWASVTGFSIAIGLGLSLAALMDLIPPLRWILMPILILSQTIPTFVIAVMLILVFGFGFGPKIIVVILFTFFPIALNTLNGLRSVERSHMELLRSMGANPLQTWWKVRLPTAMPYFFSGLRLSATYCVVGAVIGEYVGSGNGLGKFMQSSYRSFREDQVFLSVFLIAGMSIAFVLTVSLVEVLALRWRYIGQGQNLDSIMKWLRTRFAG